jgi:hypothetical protein
MDRRFRDMLMMDYATKNTDGLLSKQQGATGGLLSGLSNISPELLIGSQIVGAGLRGVDPFSAVTPAVFQTAQIQKALTPKRQPLKAAYDPRTGQNVFATEAEIIQKGLQPTQTGQVIESTPGGGFRIVPASMAKGQMEKADEASALLNANQQFNFVGERIKSLIEETPTGAVGGIVSAIEGVGDQLSQAAQQLGIRTGYQVQDDSLINSAIEKASGLKEDAENFARVKSQYINLAYIMARQKEPTNPRLSDADIARQLDRLSVGQSRQKQLAALDEVLITENKEAQRRYESLTGQKIPTIAEEDKKKKDQVRDPLGLLK